MRLSWKRILPALALATPCALVLGGQASAIEFPDRTASCDRNGLVNAIRSSDGASCTRLGKGFYAVSFPYAGGPGLGVCTVTGSIGTAGTLPFLEPTLESGEIALTFPPGPIKTAVWVQTYNSRGKKDDRGIRVLVGCPPAKGPPK